jgi:hypothetical protein
VSGTCQEPFFVLSCLVPTPSFSRLPKKRFLTRLTFTLTPLTFTAGSTLSRLRRGREADENR